MVRLKDLEERLEKVEARLTHQEFIRALDLPKVLNVGTVGIASIDGKRPR